MIIHIFVSRLRTIFVGMEAFIPLYSSQFNKNHVFLPYFPALAIHSDYSVSRGRIMPKF